MVKGNLSNTDVSAFVFTTEEGKVSTEVVREGQGKPYLVHRYCIIKISDPDCPPNAICTSPPVVKILADNTTINMTATIPFSADMVNDMTNYRRMNNTTNTIFYYYR